jgi:hypothetical protein
MRVLRQNRARTSSLMLMKVNHVVPRYAAFPIQELLHNYFSSNTLSSVNSAYLYTAITTANKVSNIDFTIFYQLQQEGIPHY